jgi:hypothetical protein
VSHVDFFFKNSIKMKILKSCSGFKILPNHYFAVLSMCVLVGWAVSVFHRSPVLPGYASSPVSRKAGAFG